MALLDTDKDVVSRLERFMEIDRNIHKQVFDQKNMLFGNTSNYNYVTLFYTDMTSGKPEIYYFGTEVKKDQMIRFNYELAYFHGDYNRMYAGKENVVVGDEVLNEIAEEVKERFTRVAQGKDIMNLFVQDRLPQML